MTHASETTYDAILIGSGFGGAMAALPLVRAGWRVLLLERGGWVERGEGDPDDVWDFFQLRDGYRHGYASVLHAGRAGSEGICEAVGGASTFYGGVSFRLREVDFDPGPEIVGVSGAAWPIGYAELEPFYTRAERLLDVAGEAGVDPTEPARSAPYPRPPAPLAPISARIADAARRLGLHPFRLPLALDDSCAAATSCDGYAWGGVGRVIRDFLLPEPGFELRTRVAATRLVEAGGRIVGVECRDLRTGARQTLRAGTVVLAAGALATPHLLLASGLERLNPAGEAVGRYLMRHCNAFVYGLFPGLPEPGRHHKQVAVNDFYLAAEGEGPRKLGNIQQVMHPQLGGLLGGPARALRRAGGPGRAAVRAAAWPLRRLTHRLTGLQVIAEDQPQASNRVELDPGTRDADGLLPGLRVRHDYSARDLAARAALVRRAREILREARALPALYEYRVTTFSHAVGTVRMGTDPATAPLDARCRFRGVENLYVSDGSVMPTSGGVNPSLTIAANALRVGEGIARGG